MFLIRKNEQSYTEQLRGMFGLIATLFALSASIICFLEMSLAYVCALFLGGVAGSINCYLLAVIKQRRLAQVKVTADSDGARVRASRRRMMDMVCGSFSIIAAVVLAYFKGILISACFLSSYIGAFSFVAYRVLTGQCGLARVPDSG